MNVLVLESFSFATASVGTDGYRDVRRLLEFHRQCFIGDDLARVRRLGLDYKIT